MDFLAIKPSFNNVSKASSSDVSNNLAISASLDCVNSVESIEIPLFFSTALPGSVQ